MHSLHQLVVLVLVASSASAESLSPKIHPDSGLKIDQFLEKYGYPFESHDVQTEDGYILTMHRVPRGSNETDDGRQRPAVLLMHGLLSCSIDWVNMGPEKALGLRLADAGFDVWLGNQRGNTYGKNHVILNAEQNQSEFFNFSFHEIGLYDIAAKIDHILDTTGQSQLTYVAHSQGTTAFFVLTSLKPEYNDKVNVMVALAPVAFMENAPGPIPRFLADNEDLVNQLVEELNIHELLPYSELYDILGQTLCANESEWKELCAFVIFALGGIDSEQLDRDFLSVIVSNDPAGASSKQILHYIHEMNSGNFSQYDYGTEENLERYGEELPPNYDVTKITVPILLYYADKDWMTAPTDVEKLADLLPNAELNLVPYGNFSHLDFLWATDINEYLNDDVFDKIVRSWS